jgi:hypothetical protein
MAFLSKRIVFTSIVVSKSQKFRARDLDPFAYRTREIDLQRPWPGTTIPANELTRFTQYPQSEGEDIRKLPLSMRKLPSAAPGAPRRWHLLSDFEQGEIGPDLFRHA